MMVGEPSIDVGRVEVERHRGHPETQPGHDKHQGDETQDRVGRVRAASLAPLSQVGQIAFRLLSPSIP